MARVIRSLWKCVGTTTQVVSVNVTKIAFLSITFIVANPQLTAVQKDIIYENYRNWWEKRI